MNREILTFGLGLGAILLASQMARAEPTGCAERSEIVARLAEDYGETRQLAGLAGPDQVLELFASLTTGTWTITITTPSGIACLVAAGESFMRFNAALPPVGDPA